MRNLLVLAHHLSVDIIETVVGIASTNPNLLRVEKQSMHDHGDNTSKRETVGHGEGSGEKEGRVCLVLCDVQTVVGSQNSAHIIRLLSVVPRTVVTEWQPVRVKGISPVHSCRYDPIKDDDTNQCVSKGVPGRDKRRQGVGRNRSPIEGNGQKSHTTESTEHLVDVDIVRGNPSRENKVTESIEHVSGDPVPTEGSSEDVKEEPKTADRPTVSLGRVGGRVIVQSVHETAVDKILWPNHVGGFDQPPSNHTSHTKADHLSGETQ